MILLLHNQSETRLDRQHDTIGNVIERHDVEAAAVA